MTLGDIGHDVRYGARRLLASPGFTMIAVLTLALGIGASTSIFSVIHGVLLNPYPYADADGILVFEIRYPGRPRGSDRAFLMGAELAEFRSQVTAAGELAFLEWGLNIVQTTDEGSRRLNGALASSRTFAFFGVVAMLGRTLVPDDSRPDAEPVFVISHRAWAEHYGLSPDVVGRTFTLNGARATLVGIMPPRFTLFGADVWQPMTMEPPASGTGGRAYSYFVRLGPGATIEEAEAQFRIVADRLAKVFPHLYGEGFTVKAVRLIDNAVGSLRTTLYIFAAAVGLLLLIACGNVANMMLARASTREREMAIRASIGGTRPRLLRQLLTESVLLACPSGIAGVALAHACLTGIVALVPPNRIPGEAVIGLNWQALLFSIAISCATALVFGVVPALHITRRNLTELLRGPGVGQPFRGERLRAALVVGEVALSIVMLAGAGVLIRSYVNIQRVELGFRADNLMFARIRLPEDRYASPAATQQFFDQVIALLQTVPSVSAVAAASQFPLAGGFRSGIDVAGRPHEETFPTMVQLSTASYFPAAGLRLLRGRFFSEDEVAARRQVAVVNEALARRYFGATDPVGRQITVTDPVGALRKGGLANQTFEVVGIVADMKNRGPREASWPEAFLPLSVAPAHGRVFLVRSEDEPTRLVNSIRAEIWAIDRNVVIEETAPVAGVLRRFHYAEPRFSLSVLSAFAAAGLVLVMLGVYGVIAYTVARQTHAIGIRMALGASPQRVRGMVLGRTMYLVGAGVAIGLVGALFATRVLVTQLWGVTANDPATLGTVVALILCVGLAAGLLPAHHAARIDPIIGLRSEP